MQETKPVFDWILAHWSFCAFILAIFIQITPAIKWNPITAFFKWISKLLVADLRKDVADMRSDFADLKKDVTEVNKAIDDNEKDRIRWEILDFANSCRNDRKHTKDEFQHIIDLHDKYDKLLEKTGDTNGVFEEEYQFILRLYHERQEKNDFL